LTHFVLVGETLDMKADAVILANIDFVDPGFLLVDNKNVAMVAGVFRRFGTLNFG
jgi:hypothetical protein